MKWLRPSGSEIETNNSEESIKQGLAMGWERLEEIPEEVIEPPILETFVVNNPPALNIVEKTAKKSPKKSPAEPEVFASPNGSFSAEYDGRMLNFKTRAEAEEAVEKEQERIAEQQKDDEMTA